VGKFRNRDFEDSLVWNDSGSAPDTDFSSLQYAQVDTTKACSSHFTQPVALLTISPGEPATRHSSTANLHNCLLLLSLPIYNHRYIFTLKLPDIADKDSSLIQRCAGFNDNIFCPNGTNPIGHVGFSIPPSSSRSGERRKYTLGRREWLTGDCLSHTPCSR